MAIQSKVPKALILIFSITVILYGARNTFAQESTPSETALPLESGTILLRNYKGQIWRLDAMTGAKNLVANVEMRAERVADVEVDTQMQRLYVLESAGSGGGVRLGNSDLLQLDLSTGRQSVVFEQKNIFDMQLSPDREKVLLFYYPANLNRIMADEPYFTCVLNFETRECKELGGIGHGAIWVAKGKLLWSDTAHNWHLIDLATSDDVALPMKLIGAAPIPAQTDKVLLSQVYPRGFYILDLNTHAITPYAPSPQLEGFRIPPFLLFSPDGKYLLYTYAGSYHIIDFASGRVVAELSNIGLVQWLPNSQSIVGVSYPKPGEYPGYIVRYGIATGHLETLTSFDEASVVSVVP